MPPSRMDLVNAESRVNVFGIPASESSFNVLSFEMPLSISSGSGFISEIEMSKAGRHYNKNLMLAPSAEL